MRLSQRKIHLIALLMQMVFYGSLALFLYTYLQTHGDNLYKLTPEELSHMLSWATVGTIAFGFSATFCLFVGIGYFVKINDASESMKTLNKVNGVLLSLGGLGISLFVSIYLIFND